MSKVTIGIVDYDVGNHASVWRALHILGYRCRLSRDPQVLGESDIVVLPGVGAFPKAMASLRAYGLDSFLKDTAQRGRPLVGICLGMQLLADASEEHGVTEGLGIIPGRVVAVSNGGWHIGWNAIEADPATAVFGAGNGETMYFNHSFHFVARGEHVVASTMLEQRMVAAVRRDTVVGIQFHPEKSQVPGHALLKRLVEDMAGA